MSPPPAVAEKLCCAIEDTDSRSNSPLPFRRHTQQPVTPGKSSRPQQQQQQLQQPLLTQQESRASPTGEDLVKLQQIFAEAGSTLPSSTGCASTMALTKNPRPRPATATAGVNNDKPKKSKLFKRLTRDLSRSNLSLPNLKKVAAAGDKEQQQQQHLSGEKKAKVKGKAKEKINENASASVELRSTSPETREVLLSRTYDSDAASLPDVRESVVERLTRTVALTGDDENKAKISPVRGKRCTERRGDVSGIDWSGNGGGAPYGWSEPSTSAPILSLRIPERLSDLGVLPSCNVSVEDLLQLNQPSGRNSPWKRFAEQHLPMRSKSADVLVPNTPNLKPTELPSLSSSFTSKACRLSMDGTHGPKIALSEGGKTILEDKAQDEVRPKWVQHINPSLEARQAHSLPSTTHHDIDTTHQTASEFAPETGHYHPNLGPSVARRASVNIPPSSLPDSESASVHLHNMRISQHLRSESTLSSISRATSGVAGAQSQPPIYSVRGSFAHTNGLGVPSLHAQHSNGTVRVRALRGSSSGFASERVPEGWGNVVSAAPSSIYGASEKAYEPSSVYSTRQNSLASTTTAPKLTVAASSSTVGSNGNMKKSGFQVLNSGNGEVFKMNHNSDMIETKKETEDSSMPGAFPPSNSMTELERADTGLTFRTATERVETYRSASDGTEQDRGKQPMCETSGSSEQMSEAGEREPLRPNQQSMEETNDTSLDITPVTAVESPVPSEKTPRARITTPVSSTQPANTKNKKKTPSIRTPSKRFSTFSFFRSKTYANLRRASHSPAIHARKASKSEENIALDVPKDNDAAGGALEIDNGTDGPSDFSGVDRLHHASDNSSRSHDRLRYHSHPFGQGHNRGYNYPGDTKDSVASEPVEEHKAGRLSRSWLIDDVHDASGRMLGQSAVWEKALQKHREEKSALFLSPEKGGKVEARGLFRERSGSGSAISMRSKQSDRKGKGPAVSTDYTFGDRSPAVSRSLTVLLDPLEKGIGEELAHQKEKTGMLGDELRVDQMFGALTPGTGVSPCDSLTRQPSVMSIEKDLNIDSWGGTTLADIDLGDLGAWSRYPSHTREQRTGPAGAADNVRTRDFAYEMINVSAVDNADPDSNEEDENSRGGIKRLTTLRPKKRSKARSNMSTSNSMTFSRNFNFLKHYIGLFRSQSEEFRKHGHGHRSSIAESGTLEHPELEILPPVFSPVTFEIPDASQLHTDGTNSKTDLSTQMMRDMELQSEEGKTEQSEAEETTSSSSLPRIVSTNRREEGKTDSSDGSWKANARLWTRTLGSDSDHGNHRLLKKTDSSTEWWSNARTWTRYSTPSQDFVDMMEDARQRNVFTPSRLKIQAEDPAESLTEGTTIAIPEKGSEKILEESSERVAEALKEKPGHVPEKVVEKGVEKGSERFLTANRTKRTRQSSSDEWRSDARLFSQMYESCVQIPSFNSSSENANAYEKTQNRTERKHRRSSSTGTAFRVASMGRLDDILGQGPGNAEKPKVRAMSGSYGDSSMKIGNKSTRNDSFLSIGSGVEGSTMDLMRFLQDMEDGEGVKLEA